MTNADNEDLREILQSAQRPRALTEAEERRMLSRIGDVDKLIVGLDPSEVGDLRPDTMGAGGRSRIGSWKPWIAGFAAAVTLLFMVVSVRVPAEPETVLPLDTAPTITLPEPDAPAQFCTDHVDAISAALERWRGLENWAFSGGTPDIGKLADDALIAADEFDLAASTSRATAARDRLRTAVDQIDGTASGRDLIAPRVAAVEPALDTIAAIASEVPPRCDLTRLNAARDLG